MIEENTWRKPEEFVQIRTGCSHPLLGDVGEWRGAVLRTFAVEGVTYLDIELTGETQSAIENERKKKFYREKIVFTRIRIPRSDTNPVDCAENRVRRHDAVAAMQAGWFKEIGASLGDPTLALTGESGGGAVDESRRAVLKTLAMAGAGILLLAITQCNQCNNQDGSGTWGRGGGGFYG